MSIDLEVPIKVLDHGYVKFVASMGTDESIIEAARMSTGKGFEGWEKDAKLLEYLYKNQHSTPFEMCELAIEVQAPLMVFREWHRSRTQSYNEASARYSQMPDLHYLPSLERFQKQSATNKQGSAEPLDREVAFHMQQEMDHDQKILYENYEAAIGDGLAKEVARLNTPVSRYSKMRAKANLRNWFHFLNLRMRPSAQYEIRMYAEAVAKIVGQLWPRSYALFEEYDLGGTRLSATETVLVKQLLGSPDAFDRDARAALLKRFG